MAVLYHSNKPTNLAFLLGFYIEVSQLHGFLPSLILSSVKINFLVFCPSYSFQTNRNCVLGSDSLKGNEHLLLQGNTSNNKPSHDLIYLSFTSQFTVMCEELRCILWVSKNRLENIRRKLWLFFRASFVCIKAVGDLFHIFQNCVCI